VAVFSVDVFSMDVFSVDVLANTLLAVGGVGLSGFHISGVASGRPRCGGGFRGDDGCTPSLGLSVDTDFTATSII